MEDANVTEAAEKPCRCAWRIAEVGPNPLNYNFLAAWRRPRSSAVSGAVTSCAEHTGAANRLPASVFAPLFVRISSGSRLFAGVLPVFCRRIGATPAGATRPKRRPIRV